jgi:hypothetical protein
MRALRQRRGQHPGSRPRGRPAQNPLPRNLSRPALRRLAYRHRSRADRTALDNADWKRRCSAQARKLEAALARIAELERLLAEARGTEANAEEGAEGTQPSDAPNEPGEPSNTPGGEEGGTGPGPSTQPGGATGGAGEPTPRPPAATPRPGIMEVRRQLHQALSANAELRRAIEELRHQLALLQRRCDELTQNLDTCLHGQQPTETLTLELEQTRRAHAETAQQRERLLARLIELGLHGSDATTGPAVDYSAGRNDLFAQLRAELEVRDRFAQWESAHRPRETDRRLDPTRPIDEQALVATLAVRWQHIDHAPQTFRHRSRWIVDGVLLDPQSEQFLIRQSRERVAYRQRIMAASAAPVT